MSTATLANHRVTKARASIPAWGIWYADATIDGEAALSGTVDLKIADLTLRGTVISGGPAKGRAEYRIVGGKGGWGRKIPKESYQTDAGVKASSVIGDAARLVGETLDTTNLPNTMRVGPAWVRPADEPASRVLELIVPSGWYVDELGTTRIGRRAAGQLVGKVTRPNPADRARGFVELAAESIATILPGLVVDGLTAVDVQHEINDKGGLRSRVWGSQTSSASRELDALRRLIDQLDPDRRYGCTWEYRVVTREGNRLNLQPVRVSTGMPDLLRVAVNPGLAGAKANVALGSTVLVQFVDKDPGRPRVVGFEDADGGGFEPDSITISSDTTIDVGGTSPLAKAAALNGLMTALSAWSAGPTNGGLTAAFTASLTALGLTVATTKLRGS